MLDPSIFKAYDVRGIYPSQINAELARRIGRAFVDYLGARRIAVGRDVRVSSPEIAAAFIRGRARAGLRRHRHRHRRHRHAVLLLGSHDLDGGAIITASHNPKEYNGIKMVRRGRAALSGDAGIKEIREALKAGQFLDAPDRQAPEP